jgi:hypothetical protein
MGRGPTGTTERPGMKRAREPEEAGAVTAETRGRVDNESERMRQAVRSNRPSKLGHDKSRSTEVTRKTAEVEHAAARPPAPVDIAAVDVEPLAMDVATAATGTKKKRRKQKSRNSAANKARRGGGT